MQTKRGIEMCWLQNDKCRQSEFGALNLNNWSSRISLLCHSPTGKKQNKTNKLTLHSTPLTQYESSVLITTAQRSKNATTEWREKQEWVPVRNQRDGSAKIEIIQETRSSSPVWLDDQQRRSGHSEHSDKNTLLCSIRWNSFCAWNSRNVNINTETKPGPAHHHSFNTMTWKIEEEKKKHFINKTS